ncbi:MAG: epoxyqueuosine reductase QueH [Candidatus Omnitrophota bacterium]|nr:epoxyqueuosine reductase QueH [Candidatus Omnitrophota bacterium]
MKILLHICCGVCATSVVERLMCEGHTVTGFFYNPNIHPVDEYERRLEAARKVAGHMGFELVEGPYDRENWFQLVKGKEYEPEGGKRCEACFRMRLEKTYLYMKRHMFGAFTATLTVSPLKDAALVNAIGREIGDEAFICADFKKKGGFARAMEVAQELELYRQDYCGCIYSLEQKYAREKKRN